MQRKTVTDIKTWFLLIEYVSVIVASYLFHACCLVGNQNVNILNIWLN